MTVLILISHWVFISIHTQMALTLEMGTELREIEKTLPLYKSLPLSAVSLFTSLMNRLDQQISRGPSSSAVCGFNPTPSFHGWGAESSLILSAASEIHWGKGGLSLEMQQRLLPYTEHQLCARCWAESFMCIVWILRAFSWAQRGWVSCPRSHQDWAGDGTQVWLTPNGELFPTWPSVN